LLSGVLTVDLVEHSTSGIDDFSVVSRVPVTVSVCPLGYLTWENAFYHIFEVGGRRPPASHATLTTGQRCKNTTRETYRCKVVLSAGKWATLTSADYQT